jgi:hypothetical protein
MGQLNHAGTVTPLEPYTYKPGKIHLHHRHLNFGSIKPQPLYFLFCISCQLCYESREGHLNKWQ